MRGRLIVFEGAEGVGKSTQLRRLSARLAALDVPHVAVREPGGTPLGDEIRAILLERDRVVAARAEALLFMASRAQLIEGVMRPELERGRLVLLDRFFLSTYAYQVGGRGLPEEEIRVANHLATGGLVPDLTLLLDIPVNEGLARAARRGARDRMEASGEEFHARVAAAFERFTEAEWLAAHPECGPVVRIAADGSVADVERRIVSALAARFPETFARDFESHLHEWTHPGA